VPEPQIVGEGFQNAGSVGRAGGCSGLDVHARARIADRAGPGNS
jgi:hypothetical protein